MYQAFVISIYVRFCLTMQDQLDIIHLNLQNKQKEIKIRLKLYSTVLCMVILFLVTQQLYSISSLIKRISELKRQNELKTS